MANKRSLGSLLVQVGADTKQLNSALGDAEAKVKGFGSRVKREATGTRASFSGMGNSASAALSRMGALGGGLSMLGGLGTAAGAAGAAAGLGVAGFRAIKKSAIDAHPFSSVSVRRRAELAAEGVSLNSQFGGQLPLLTSAINNFGATLENETKKLVLAAFPNDRAFLDTAKTLQFLSPQSAPQALGDWLGRMLAELVGIRSDAAQRGNETPPASNQSAPMNEAPASGPPMNALGNNRGGY